MNASGPSYYTSPKIVSRFKKRVKSLIKLEPTVTQAKAFKLNSIRQDTGLPSVFAKDYGSSDFCFQQKFIPRGSKLVFLHGPCSLLRRSKNKKGFMVPSCINREKYYTIDRATVKRYQVSGNPITDFELDDLCAGSVDIFTSYECEKSKMLIFFFKENDRIPSIRVEREKDLNSESTTIFDFPGYVALSMVYNEPDIVAQVSPHLESVSTSTWGETGFGSRKCTKSIGFNNYAGKRDTNNLVQSVL